MKQLLTFVFFLLASSVIAQDSDRYPFCEDGLWGYIDHTGATVIKPVYHNVGKFSEGLAPVRKGGTYGYINASGTTVLRPKYDYAGGFVNGCAIVYIDGYGFLIGRQGEKITQTGYLAIERVDGTELLKIKNENGYGFMDEKGNVVLKPYYDLIGEFYYGLTAAHKFRKYTEDKTGEDVTIDPQGRVVPTPDEIDYTLPEKGEGKKRPEYELSLSHEYNSERQIWIYTYTNRQGTVVKKFEESRLPNYDQPIYFEADRRAFTSDAAYAQQKQPVAENGPICLSVTGFVKERHLLISNCSSDTVHCPVKDGALILFVEATDSRGEWQYITKIYPSGCGNSYYDAYLLPSSGADIALPEMEGAENTRLRVAMVYYQKEPGQVQHGKSIIAYSNIFAGTINPGQLLDIPRENLLSKE